jgi:hypothetical protein
MTQILFGTIMNNTGKVICIEEHTASASTLTL